MTKGNKFIQWVNEKKQWILVGAVIVGVFLYNSINKNDMENSIDFIEENNEQIVENLDNSNVEKDKVDLQEEQSIIKVDIKGAVAKPGVYTANQGERVIDIINRAGGFLNDADETNINLSQKLTDEMVIYVPKVGETIADVGTMQPNASNENGKVNINQAESADLQSLPGIGPSKAEAIIEYRDTNGPFQKIEDLMNISGIGEKTFEKLKEQITVQ